MRNKLKSFVSVILMLCILSSVGFTVSADDPLPAPDWVQISTNKDGSKTVTVTTPPYMSDVINYYEYSVDSGLTWEKLSDPTGGEFVFDTTTEFSLRYVYSGFRSTVYTVTVTVSKTTTVTSSAGITLLIPLESEMPTDVTLSAYEIISGTYYSAVYNFFGENRPFRLFDVTIMRNNKVYNTDIVNTWLFPKGDFDIEYCKIYYLSDNGDLYLLDSQPELNMLTVNTDRTGIFVVVEDRSYCKGDVTGDALITASDARLALRKSAQLEELNETELSAADYNGDGTVTSADARLILRVSAGLEA